MNILAGLYRPDDGQILVDGEPVTFRSPRDAIAARHRDGPSALRARPVADRHRERAARAWTGRASGSTCARPRPRSKGSPSELGLHVDPRGHVWQLSVGEQQRVEILKMLYRGARILIMDEPTAVLAPQEAEELFVTLRSMTAAGRSVVFISHKLGEVLAIADRITVMRRGKVTAAGVAPGGHDSRPISPGGWWAGPCSSARRARRSSRVAVVLSVSGVRPTTIGACPPCAALSLDVRAGEIVGIAAGPTKPNQFAMRTSPSPTSARIGTVRATGSQALRRWPERAAFSPLIRSRGRERREREIDPACYKVRHKGCAAVVWTTASASL